MVVVRMLRSCARAVNTGDVPQTRIAFAIFALSTQRVNSGARACVIECDLVSAHRSQTQQSMAIVCAFPVRSTRLSTSNRTAARKIRRARHTCRRSAQPYLSRTKVAGKEDNLIFSNARIFFIASRLH
jgi:hypothetical protein